MAMVTFVVRDSFLEAARSLPNAVAKKLWKAVELFSKNPSYPGLHFENLRGKATGLQSLRVDEKYRVIIQRTAEAVALFHVAPEEEAYRFADRFEPVAVSGSAVSSNPVAAGIVKDLLLPGRKYLPLARHLLSQASSQAAIVLTFLEIERIIDAPLPPSARCRRAWWANDRTRHVQAAAWLGVGWIVEKVDFAAETVTFARPASQAHNESRTRG